MSISLLIIIYAIAFCSEEVKEKIKKRDLQESWVRTLMSTVGVLSYIVDRGNRPVQEQAVASGRRFCQIEMRVTNPYWT